MGKTVLAFVLTVMASAALAHDVDLTKLPLGDGKLSAAPMVGQIWACRVDPEWRRGAGGRPLDQQGHRHL